MDKCYFCKKNTLLNFKCKCENNFCINHRLPESHNCAFDFFNHNKEKLRLENPVISSTKIYKI